MTEQQNTEHRPWGHYTILTEAPNHKVKRITVLPGKRLSLQSHHCRDEHWYIVQGRGTVTLNDQVVQLVVGNAVDIPKESRHRIANQGEEPLVFIEIQRGDYFGEDDIERFADDYGRE